MLELIVYIIVIYFFVVFVLARFFIPHLSFKDDILPTEIPKYKQKVIDELKVKAKSNEEFLELAYDYIGNKYWSERFSILLKFNYLFKNLDEVWQMNGFMPCTQSNFLLRVFLVRSGFFKDEEIRRRHVFVNFIPHQYLQVKIKDKWIDVDVGEKQRGVSIGKHLKYFG